MCDIQTSLIIFFFIVVILWLVYPDVQFFMSKNMSSNHDDDKAEGFFGGYYYPYDYPYYWPYFYTGCNENVFGDIKCLPMYMHPFW